MVGDAAVCVMIDEVLLTQWSRASDRVPASNKAAQVVSFSVYEEVRTRGVESVAHV